MGMFLRGFVLPSRSYYWHTHSFRIEERNNRSIEKKNNKSNQLKFTNHPADYSEYANQRLGDPAQKLGGGKNN
jgi:hypothetical protein